MIIYTGVRYLLWGNSGSHIIGEGEGMMYKNYYDHALGMEDFSGYINRLVVNSNFYLSYSFYTILGLRREATEPELDPFLTILTYGMMLFSVILTFRKNKYLLFTGLNNSWRISSEY